MPEQAFADFSTFELKCAILLGLPAHLRLLAATLGRLLQQPLFVEWLSAGSASPFRQPERDDPITGDVSLEKNAAGLAVSIGSRCVLQLPDTASLTVNDLQQYVDQLARLGVRRGMVLVEQGLLQTHPSAMPPDDAAPMSGLSATLVLPDYVMLTRDPAFCRVWICCDSCTGRGISLWTFGSAILGK